MKQNVFSFCLSFFMLISFPAFSSVITGGTDFSTAAVITENHTLVSADAMGSYFKFTITSERDYIIGTSTSSRMR